MVINAIKATIINYNAFCNKETTILYLEKKIAKKLVILQTRYATPDNTTYYTQTIIKASNACWRKKSIPHLYMAQCAKNG